MPDTVVRAALARAALAVAILAAAPHTIAADEFKITPAQLQALGVRLLRLDKPGQDAGQAFPARVVLPPSQEQLLSAPLAGSVDQLLVTENTSVRSGQPLLRLLSPELGELQLRLAEAASRARLSQQTLARERLLLADGIVPERRVHEAEASAAEDRARQAQAEAALRLAGADAALIQRVAAGGPLQEGLLLRARSSGVVTRIEVKPGQRVQAADALVRLADPSRLWLDVQLPAEQQTRLAPVGATLSGVDRDMSARSLSIAPLVSDNQTVTLRAEVTRGAAGLRVGEVLQVRVPAAGGAAWSLPQAAVVRHEGKAWVFVRSAQGFVATPVEVQAGAGDSLTVRGALKSGQELAVGSVVALKAAWLGKGGGE